MLTYKSVVIAALAQSFVLLLLAYIGLSDMKSTIHNIVGISCFVLSLGVICFNQREK